MLTFSHYDLLDEVHGPVKLLQSSLNFKRDALEPVLSKNNIDLHYGKLYKGYVDRYNKGEGDPFFNQAGAFLHNIYFSQLQAPHDEMPTGDALTFIEKHFKSWSQFKEQFEKEAMMFKGSGWIYLDKIGRAHV